MTSRRRDIGHEVTARARASAGQQGAAATAELLRARHDAEAAVARLATILDSMLDPYIVLEAVRDAGGVIVDLVYTDANAAACAYLNIPRDTLLGKGLLQLMPGQKEAGYFDMYAGVVESREPVVLDGISYELEVLPGERHYFDVRAVPLGDGIALTWRDVTQRHRDALRIAESEEHLRATLDSLMDPLIVVTPVRDAGGTVVDFHFVFANTAACADLRRSTEELAGASFREIFPGVVASGLLAALVSALESGGPVAIDDALYENELLGERRRYDIRASRVGADLAFTWRDVTARHEAEETIRARVTELSALQRLSELLVRRGEFAGALEAACGLLVTVFGARATEVRVLSRELARTGDQLVASAGERLPAVCGPAEAAIAAAVSGGGETGVACEDGASLLVVPLVAHGETVGSLAVLRGAAFDPAERGVAQTAAEMLAAVVWTERLHRLETEEAATRERQRIARDLHDAVTQSIYAASFTADALPELWRRDPQQAAEKLEMVRRLIRAALAELRILLYELRPEALATAPLSTLLERLGDALAGQGEIEVDLAVAASLELPEQVRLTFYRVAQEALNNITKYAQAAHVHVMLDDDGEELCLTIRDDGRGFDTTAFPPGMGLGIMRERALAIGAEVVVSSEPGRGTTVQLVWPHSAAELTGTGSGNG